MGWPWVSYRIRRMVAHRLHFPERKLPVGKWEDYLPEVMCSGDVSGVATAMRRRLPLRFDRAEIRRFVSSESPAAVSELRQAVDFLRAGKISFFSGQVFETGWPPQWHHNSVDGTQTDSIHFSRISTFGNGDIKNFWEPGRFGFVVLLLRAWERGLADDAPQLFWQAVEDFAEKNPPMVGVQYLCGQEVSIRSMALLVGWAAFSACAESTDERMKLLWAMLAANGQRIEGDIQYALSQKNNHGISEAVGLLTIGLQLTEHPRAEHWMNLGHRLLKDQMSELVYEDGGFSQHSANYHRVMMQAVTFGLAVARSSDRSFPELSASLRAAAMFLLALIDKVSGGVPRYGNDDGAFLFQWSACGYDDFRPAVQDALAVTNSEDCLPEGLWDEGAAWLGQAVSRRNTLPDRLPMTILPQGGMVVLRQKALMSVLRVPCPVHRTCQLDTLHVDLWWRGVNIAIDPGTYRYNAAGKWNAMPLARDPAHNVVGVRGVPQADTVSRFLFLPWPEARIVESDETSIEARYVGAIGRVEDWTRTVRLLDDEICCVIDRVSAEVSAECELRWHLAGSSAEISSNGYQNVLMTCAGPLTVSLAVAGADKSSVDWRYGDATSTRGWYAPRYGQLEPNHDVVLSATGTFLTFCTVFAAGRTSLSECDTGWKLTRGTDSWLITA